MSSEKESTFWAWYERNYTLNVGIAAGLFTLQLVHLYWLTTDVIAPRLFGESFFSLSPLWRYLIVAVDYTEIPALISTSLVYLYEARQGWNRKSIAYLFFINSQWLHIFWITDEFIISHFRDVLHPGIFPPWLAWVAIFIDYLELPVIVDTIRRVIVSVKRERFLDLLAHVSRYYTWRI